MFEADFEWNLINILCVKFNNTKLYSLSYATGPSDILEHNLKQILSLLWHLILRYQVSETDRGSKTLMLDWMNATLPDKDISNFTTDWNDGINLSALVNYCKPSCSGWVRSEWEKWSGEKEIRPLDHACEEEVVRSHDCACPEHV